MQLIELAKVYRNVFGFNVLPIEGKRPTIPWENWQLIEQSKNDVINLGWNSAITGIGGICGINDLRNIDFDKVSDFAIVELICKRLGLGEKYMWIVKSGSGVGYHIWIKASESEQLHKRLNGPKSVYRLYLKDEGLCDHIELRWNQSQTVLPDSKHESGNRYSFLYDEPKEPPSGIDAEILLECLDEYCDLQKEKEILEIGKRTFEPASFDKEKLESAIEFLESNLPSNCYEEWYRIGFGLVTIGEEGRRYFLKMSLGNQHYNDSEFEINKKFDSLQKDYDGKITLGTIYHIAEKFGWQKPFVKFWYIENDKTKISKQNFKRFLEENGFCKLQLERGYILLKVSKNIVREVEIFNIKDFVIDYLKRLDDVYFQETPRIKVIDAVIKGAPQHFVQTFLEFLETRELEFLRDSKEKGFLFFSNCFVEITSNKISDKKYEELEGFIWDKQVINKRLILDKRKSRLTLSEPRQAEFERFTKNICKNDEQRILSLRSAIGYLLHNYKDSTNAKAVIFLDEKLSDGAYGRSGKGLVAQAIGKLRKTIRLDGRNFNFSKSFSFQSVTLDTAIIEFNDVTKKFNFDKLFSIITDDITVEKKNQNEIIIPFHQSPKIIISTNYTIEGSDDSALDRQFVVEFSDHYNKAHRPIDEFGHRFFDEWSNDEWNSFINYMIGCLQLYLSKGLIQCNHVNLEKKKMIDSTCEEFVEFFAEIKIGKEFLKKELFENFKKVYEEYSEMQLVRFTRWLKEAAKIKGIKIVERKSGIERYIRLGEAEKVDEMDATFFNP
ncbi:MAG: bifunctional DNA primase/polymerase [Bacteroidetes bacterium]|nr:bifunctional DNA primase/polymerase [Bacteroidota bacterium]